jgi:hypothetical protein
MASDLSSGTRSAPITTSATESNGGSNRSDGGSSNGGGSTSASGNDNENSQESSASNNASESGKEQKNIAAITGGVVGGLVALGGLIFLFLCMRRKRERRRMSNSQPSESRIVDPLLVSYQNERHDPAPLPHHPKYPQFAPSIVPNRLTTPTILPPGQAVVDVTGSTALVRRQPYSLKPGMVLNKLI